MAVARSQREAAAAQAGSTAAGGAEARLAAAALSQAEAARALAAARLEETRIRAPGRRAGAPARRGARATSSRPAARSSRWWSTGELQLVAQVDEKNLAFLRPGLPAKATADAFPGRGLRGRGGDRLAVGRSRARHGGDPASASRRRRPSCAPT